MGEPLNKGSPMSNVDDVADDEITVYFKVTSTRALKVKRTDTIRNLKEMFCSKEGISVSLQEIFFAGETLQDEQSVADCGIKRSSTLDLILDTMSVFTRKIYIKIPSNQHTVAIIAKDRDTIQHIKSIVQAKEGIQSLDFILMHEGKFLENYQTLASLNIGNGSIFYLVYHPRDVVPISVHTPTQGFITLQVKQMQLIGDLKALVGSMTDSRVEHAILVREGEALKDSMTLAFYGIKENSMLELVYPFQIFVRVWSGKTITVDVLPTDDVKNVSEKVHSKLGIPLRSHPFFYDGKRLDEGRALSSYCIEKDSMVMMGTPRG